MLRSAVVRLGLGAAVLALPAAIFFGNQGIEGVSAQQGNLPPEPPLVMYGDAPGAEVGQGVHAFVQAGGSWTWCGFGGVLDPSGPGYVIQIASATQISGCGDDGRSIRLYFTPVGEGDQYNGSAGRMSTNNITWQSDNSVAYEQNVTLGQELEVQGLVPGLARRVE